MGNTWNNQWQCLTTRTWSKQPRNQHLSDCWRVLTKRVSGKTRRLMLGVSICGWFVLCFNMRKTNGCSTVRSLSPFGSEQRSPIQKCVNTLLERWLGYHIMNISPYYYTIRCDVYVMCLRTADKSGCYRVVKQMHEAPDSKPLLMDGKPPRNFRIFNN